MVLSIQCIIELIFIQVSTDYFGNCFVLQNILHDFYNTMIILFILAELYSYQNRITLQF